MATKTTAKREWRGVVLETKENVIIEAPNYEAAKRQMRKTHGPETDGTKTNWTVGLIPPKH